MYETVHVVFQADEGPEAGELGDLALDELADLIDFVDLLPRIFGELFDADGDALILLVDLEHLRLDVVALFDELGGVIDLTGPGEVAHVDHTVEAFFQFHKRTVAGEVAYLAADLAANGVLGLGLVPRIVVQLADTEADLLLVLVDAEYLRLDFLILLEDLGGFGVFLGPRQLGDVHEAFDTGFQLHKGAVGHEVDHLALDLGAHGVLALDEFPRVLSLLLETKGDTLFLLVDIQHHHVELLADAHHFARVIDAAPAHVGDVQQAVEAVEVNEGTEVGNVLHLALDHGAWGEVVQHLAAFG